MSIAEDQPLADTDEAASELLHIPNNIPLREIPELADCLTPIAPFNEDQSTPVWQVIGLMTFPQFLDRLKASRVYCCGKVHESGRFGQDECAISNTNLSCGHPELGVGPLLFAAKRLAERCGVISKQRANELEVTLTRLLVSPNGTKGIDKTAQYLLPNEAKPADEYYRLHEGLVAEIRALWQRHEPHNPPQSEITAIFKKYEAETGKKLQELVTELMTYFEGVPLHTSVRQAVRTGMKWIYDSTSAAAKGLLGSSKKENKRQPPEEVQALLARTVAALKVAKSREDRIQAVSELARANQESPATAKCWKEQIAAMIGRELPPKICTDVSKGIYIGSRDVEPWIRSFLHEQRVSVLMNYYVEIGMPAKEARTQAQKDVALLEQAKVI